jgi:CheY-like chemotaxis protein
VIALRSDEPRLGGRVILVVEDHQDNRELLAQLLTHDGATVLAAHDATAAFNMLEAHAPDLILADLRMTGMDGLQFARRVKADSRWARVPIVAVTAHTTMTDLHATFEAGFAAHVAKPIEWDTLMQTIERVLPAGPRPQPSRRRRKPRKRS